MTGAKDQRPVVVIMAGGAGTRFWPASTAKKPKQLLALTGERTLLQMSFDRARSVTDRILVVTNKRLVAAVRKQLPQLEKDAVVGEPSKKDTAAAVAWATLLVERRFGPSTMAVLTSDHIIEPLDTFRRALLAAMERAAASGNIYTFGIEPSYPATGYGYLEVADPILIQQDATHHAVLAFHEKPDRVTAARYVASKRFLWNSGMFVFSSATMLRELKAHLPALVGALRGAKTAAQLGKAWPQLEAISIDKGVMEKTRRIMCVRSSFQWSDVGSFPALAPFLTKYGDDNAHRGRVVAHASRNNVVWSTDPKELVALVGVEGLVVVRAGKRTLVMSAERAEELKHAVDKLPAAEK